MLWSIKMIWTLNCQKGMLGIRVVTLNPNHTILKAKQRTDRKIYIQNLTRKETQRLRRREE